MEEIDVLFVENEAYVQELYCSLAKKIPNCTFRLVPSVEEALELIKTIKFKVFVLDINFGPNKLNGIDLSLAVKEQNKDAKIYVVTGFSYLFKKISPSVAGIDLVFDKPDALIKIIKIIEKDLAED